MDQISVIPLHSRFLLAPKTQISRALRQICMFCAMDTGRQQKGVLLSKGFTLAGGFFVVQRRYGSWLNYDRSVICLHWQACIFGEVVD